MLPAMKEAADRAEADARRRGVKGAVAIAKARADAAVTVKRAALATAQASFAAWAEKHRGD